MQEPKFVGWVKDLALHPDVVEVILDETYVMYPSEMRNEEEDWPHTEQQVVHRVNDYHAHHIKIWKTR